MIALVLPYVVWILGILAIYCSDAFMAPAYIYALKTVVCAGLTLCLKPWRFVCCRYWRIALLPGLVIGVLVYVLWCLPELHPYVPLRTWYLRWCVLMPGTLPDETGSLCYSWNVNPTLTCIKLIGSAFVIAPIEEFFFRGFLMRWLTQRNWQALPLEATSPQAFWMTVLCFGFEHDRFLAGLLAGWIYGQLALRTRSLAAPIIAHTTTNLLLGITVILTQNYSFW